MIPVPGTFAYKAYRVPARPAPKHQEAAHTGAPLAALSHPPLMPRWKVILREVASRHGLSVAEVTGSSRQFHIVKARQEAMWRLRHETKLSFSEVARRCGRKDHTSALWGVAQHEAQLRSERTGRSSKTHTDFDGIGRKTAEAMAAQAGRPFSDVVGTANDPELAALRREIAWTLSTALNLSDAAIGRIVCRRFDAVRKRVVAARAEHAVIGALAQAETDDRGFDAPAARATAGEG